MQKLRLASWAFFSVLTSVAEGQIADTILVNGKMITMDAADSIAEAVAIRAGRILEVGPKLSVMELAGSATRIIVELSAAHRRDSTPSARARVNGKARRVDSRTGVR